MQLEERLLSWLGLLVGLVRVLPSQSVLLAVQPEQVLELLSRLAVQPEQEQVAFQA